MRPAPQPPSYSAPSGPRAPPLRCWSPPRFGTSRGHLAVSSTSEVDPPRVGFSEAASPPHSPSKPPGREPGAAGQLCAGTPGDCTAARACTRAAGCRCSAAAASAGCTGRSSSARWTLRPAAPPELPPAPAASAGSSRLPRAAPEPAAATPPAPPPPAPRAGGRRRAAAGRGGRGGAAEAPGGCPPAVKGPRDLKLRGGGRPVSISSRPLANARWMLHLNPSRMQRGCFRLTPDRTEKTSESGLDRLRIHQIEQ